MTPEVRPLGSFSSPVGTRLGTLVLLTISVGLARGGGGGAALLTGLGVELPGPANVPGGAVSLTVIDSVFTELGSVSGFADRVELRGGRSNSRW